MPDLPDINNMSAADLIAWLKANPPDQSVPSTSTTPAATGTGTPTSGDALLALLNKNTGTGAVSAPPGQGDLVFKNDKFDPSKPVSPTNNPIITVPSPNAAPKPTAPTPVGSADTGWYVVDPSSPNGVRLIVPAHTPNADDEISKALKRENDEQLRAQRIKNEAAGFGYADDDTVAQRSKDAQASNVSMGQLTLNNRIADQTKKNQDQIAAREDKVAAANIGLTGAQTNVANANVGQIGATTAKTGVETQQLQQSIEKTGALLPGEIAQQAATLAGTNAQTAASQQTVDASKQAMQIAAASKPVDATLGTTTPMVATTDPRTGQVTYTQNQNFLPKTAAEIAARKGQIQTLMQQKSADIQARVANKTLTPEQGLAEFNGWYAQNVQPQAASLQQAQIDAELQRAKDEAAMRTQAYTAATAAGTQAINAAREDKAGRVGPGFGDFMNSLSAGKGLAGPGADFNKAFTFQAPLVSDQAHQAVNDALKYISPAAAQGAGAAMPNYGSVDIAQQLSATPYTSQFGMPPPGPPAPVAPPAPAPAPAPLAAGPVSEAPPPPPPPAVDPNEWYQALRGRQAVDVAQQQRQAQVAGSPDQWSQWIPNYSPGG